MKEIYYEFEDAIVEDALEDSETSSDNSLTQIASTVAVASTPIPAPSMTTAAAIADKPLKAVNTLRIIIAQKLKKKLDEVLLSNLLLRTKFWVI